MVNALEARVRADRFHVNDPTAQKWVAVAEDCIITRCEDGYYDGMFSIVEPSLTDEEKNKIEEYINYYLSILDYNVYTTDEHSVHISWRPHTND